MDGYSEGDDALRQVRAAADIVELIGEHTTLVKKGKRWMGLCPFHAEKTPSFSVDRELGLYHCYGCNAGGDVFRFMREREGLSFPEAVAALAGRYGIELPKRRRASPEVDARRERLYEAMTLAAGFYSRSLTAASPAMRYLKSRAVTVDTIEELGLGFAPDAWNSITENLSSQVPPDILIEAGLCVEGKGDRPYDRFRNRLMFPISDLGGKVVGFSGRDLGELGPKYLNSPDSPIFHKGKLLYGLNLARDTMRREGYTILCEGQFDLLRLVAAGFRHVVATSGTAFTEDQADLLKRYTPAVVLAFDADLAGRKAIRNAAQILVRKGLEVSILELPEGADPDSFLREQGPDALARQLEKRRDFFAYLFESAFPSGLELAAGEQQKRLSEVLPYLRSMPEKLGRYALADALAKRVGFPTELIWEKLSASPDSRKDGMKLPPPAVIATATKASTGERRVLQLILESGILPSGLRREFFESASLGALFEQLEMHKKLDNSLDFRQIMPHLSTGEVEFLAALSLHTEDEGPPTRSGELEELIVSMEGQHLERRQKRIQVEIQAAQREGRNEDVERLYLEKLEITRARTAGVRGSKSKGEE